MSGLMDNDEHHLKLLTNHTSVVEATVDIMKKNDFEIAKHDEQLHILFRKQNATNELNDLYYYATAAANHLNQLISDFEAQQNAIIEIISDAHRNKLDSEVISTT